MVADTSLETPLDRLTRAGIHALSDAELVSLLIDADAPKTSMLLRDGLPAFARASWTGRKQPVTRRQAARIVASLELSRRLASVTDERHPVSDPEMIARSLLVRYAHHVQERLGAVYLDSKNRVLREREIYIGTLNSATVSTRDVLRFALDDHAASLIVFHNHPSGDPAPSAEDLLFTRKLVEAGKVLGVDVLDHIILGANRFVSLKQRGIM
ncbi:MAG: DNA repair protein RadC [Thermoanaerobaculia bacterium]